MRKRFVFILTLFFASFGLSAPLFAKPKAPNKPTKAAKPVPANPVPVGPSDPSWGSDDAPVTVVHFADLQCPYCQRNARSLDALERIYGPKKLRIVFKHMPLGFHDEARAAAEVGAAIHTLYGKRIFWRYIRRAFHRYIVEEASGLAPVLQVSQIPIEAVLKELKTGRPAKKVDEDMALAQRLGVDGTPTTFVNGIRIGGAVPTEALAELVEDQLDEAEDLRDEGVPANRIYAVLSKKQYTAPEPPKPPPPPDTTTVWKVPVGKSPVRGARDALVTIVAFSEFECPYCERLKPTFKRLLEKYPKELRIVFKHYPLAFHDHAMPAANFSIEAQQQRGDAGFWKAHDALFAQQDALSNDDLKALASKLKLNPARIMQAIKSNKHLERIEDDMALADDIGVNGTPCSFINGRRLEGGQPYEAFATIVEEEIDRGKKLVGDGIAKRNLYAHLMKSAKGPPPPKRLSIPAPSNKNPVRGPRNAKVSLHIFTDFECPFCSRVLPTLERVEKTFGRQVRLIYHHMPLSFHKKAPLAHNAAAEAFAQKGNSAFWKMHDLIFAHQEELSREKLLEFGKKLGLDQKKLAKAIDEKLHRDDIAADMALAEKVGIEGTPAFLVNGYLIEGAQPYTKFKRMIKRALKE